MNESDHQSARVKRRRRTLWIAILVASIAALPHVIARSPVRDVVLNRLSAQSGFRLTTRAGSFGWFSPVRLRGVVAENQVQGIALRVDRVELDKSWLSLWLGLPDLGRVVIDQPQLDVVMPSDATPQLQTRAARPVTGSFEVREGAFRLLSPADQEAIVALKEIDFDVRIEGEGAARVMELEPITVLDRAMLTPQMCDHGLQLVAPVLANATEVSGEVSLVIDDCRIPLDVADPIRVLQQADVRGKAQLHQVTSSLKDSLLGDSVEFVARLLQVELPGEVRIADDTEVTFALREGSIYHEGLMFLIPEISTDMMWQTSGSVGLDETLDLQVQVQIPFSLAGESPLTRQLTDRRIHFRIIGTLDDPQLRFPEDGGWLREASAMVFNEALPEETRPLAGSVLDVLRQLRDLSSEPSESQERQPSVFDKMRERLQTRLQERQQAQEAGSGND